MNQTELLIRKRLREDFILYARKFLKIRTKFDGFRNLELNTAQMYIHNLAEEQKRATGKVRCIILKGRQQGCSTYVEGRFYWLTTHHIGLRAFILTHDNEATNNLFELVKRYHDNCPPALQPTVLASNRKELIFCGLDSGYKLGTAGNKAVGRSSTVQLLHGSEVAYWPNASEHAKGILQAVPNGAGTEIFMESTANGVGNYFHEQWQMAESGQSEFIPIFVPWFWQAEYQSKPPADFSCSEEETEIKDVYKLSDDQIFWRRNKIIELGAAGGDGLRAFRQEYPCCPVEAFQFSGDDTFIHPNIVMRARKTVAEPYGRLLVGVDPARGGSDRTSIIYRKGRVAYNLRSYKIDDTMVIVGIIHKLIIEDKPDLVLIDSIGIGAGIYDRLIELGHKGVVISINAGSSPLDRSRYANKRAEMWSLLKLWLDEGGVQIPDVDSLHADLCGIGYRHRSNNELIMEEKSEMKKRRIRSPDEGDALALTFSVPNTAYSSASDKRTEDIAKQFGDSMRQMESLKRKAYS